MRATVFGGAKSKLRSHSASYNSGRAWVYRDPAKEYGKLSDFDVQAWRPGLRELYERSMTASAVAETILFSHGGGGNWKASFDLAAATLDALEYADEELCSRLFIYFLWHWADILGIRPHLYCNCCGCADSVLCFDITAHSALCVNCTHNESASGGAHRSLHGRAHRLSPDCLRWLAEAEQIAPSHLHLCSINNKSFAEAKSFVTAVTAGAIGKRLSSWTFG